MKNVSGILFVILVASMLGGCAPKNSQHLASFAITDPGEAISRVHPAELKKRNVKAVTIWRGVMNAELLVEVIKKNGVFPVLAYDGSKRYLGYAYLVERNHWGKWIIQYEFEATKDELKNAKFLLVNRDGSYATYDLLGDKVLKGGVNPYQPEVFDTNLTEQQKFIEQYGSTLADSDNSWRKYMTGKLLKGRVIDVSNIDSFVQEYIIGSEKWERMVEQVQYQINSGKLNSYTVNGVERIGNMKFDEFADRGSDVHDFTTTNRVVKRTMLPVIALASVAGGPLTMAGVGFGSTVYSANIDNEWHGHTLKSKFWGYELAPTFVDICESYEKLIAERDDEIRQYLQL